MAESGIVYVVDDDVSMCELIESILVRAGLKVRCFTSTGAFIGINVPAECGQTPCCLLLDLMLPGQSGLEFLEAQFGGQAPCPVIIITARASVDNAVRSMKLGAVDFLEKPFTPEALTAIVQETLKKHAATGAQALQRHAVRERIAGLSPRERELLEAIVRGNSTKMIANRLNISARTVDHHRANLMNKMQAANVADLVRMAVEAEYTRVKSGGADAPGA